MGNAMTSRDRLIVLGHRYRLELTRFRTVLADAPYLVQEFADVLAAGIPANECGGGDA